LTTSTPELLDHERVVLDDPYFYEKVIIIEDRNRKLIPFKVNPAQRILHDKLTGRDVVIKAGQLGITTLFLARYFKEVITVPGTTAVVVAHDEFLTQRLLERVRVIYDNIPSPIHTDMGPIPKPRMTADSANQKTFRELNSTFYIGTARAFVFGRGETIHRFLASELAFWPNADKILNPTFQRVPLDGEIIIESTPNGEGNRFHEIVEEAQTDDSIWTLHTLPWWLEKEYKIPWGSDKALKNDQGDLTYEAEEVSLIIAAKWDDEEAEERIRWRRRKISEIKFEFWQEFLEDLASCFLVAGNMYYDEEELGRMTTEISPSTGYAHHAQIWDMPDEDWESPNYLISVDPGQGKVTESTALVWRINPLESEKRRAIEHVATLRGMYDPQTFAPMVETLGYFYKTAKIAPERNGHGMAFCSEVKNYPNLYRQTDIVGGIETKVIGWATTGAARVGSRGTKTYMMDELNHNLPFITLRDGDVDLHDAAAIMAATRPSAMFSGKRGFIGTKGWKR
jgi:hypothetical protein